MGTFLRVVGGIVLVTMFFLPSVSCATTHSQCQLAAHEGGWGALGIIAIIAYGIWTVIGPFLARRGSRLGEAVQMMLTIGAAGALGYFIYEVNDRGCRMLWPIGVQVAAVFVVFIGTLLRWQSRTRW